MVGDYFLYCTCQSFTTVERQLFNKRFTFHNLNIMASFLHTEILGEIIFLNVFSLLFSKHLKNHDGHGSLNFGDLCTSFSKSVTPQTQIQSCHFISSVMEITLYFPLYQI